MVLENSNALPALQPWDSKLMDHKEEAKETKEEEKAALEVEVDGTFSLYVSSNCSNILVEEQVQGAADELVAVASENKIDNVIREVSKVSVAPTASESVMNAPSFFEFPTAAAPPQPFMFREAVKKQKSIENWKHKLELDIDLDKTMGDLFVDIERL
jgi:hypothetical protein